jgi:hypothetical protein
MERVFATMNNTKLDEKTRGLAAIELFQKGKIQIYAESIDIPDIIKLFYLANHLAHTSIEVFVGRILKAIKNNKLYCKHKWYVEEVK